MLWIESWRADPRARKIADRHYNRQKIGSPQFVPPGRCYVLLQSRALWVTSWPYAQHVKHRWAGAWVNSCFRRQGGRQIASEMIRDAVAATIAYSLSGSNPLWNGIPELGMITFIDSRKIRAKKESEIGRCYQEAGFRHVGFTEKDELYAFQLLPGDMPEPKAALIEVPNSSQLELEIF